MGFLAGARSLFDAWVMLAFSEGPRLSLVTTLVMLAAAVAFEATTRRDPRRNFSRQARTDVLYDVLYMVVFLGGIYGVLVSGPLLSMLQCLADHYGNPFELRLPEHPLLAAGFRIGLGSRLEVAMPERWPS